MINMYFLPKYACTSVYTCVFLFMYILRIYFYLRVHVCIYYLHTFFLKCYVSFLSKLWACNKKRQFAAICPTSVGAEFIELR